MPSYWWECDRCKIPVEFTNAVGVSGIVNYIRDVLIPSDWDQTKLLLPCSRCKSQSLRIAYEFPRDDKVSLLVVHMVGLADPSEADKEYVPMMWETLASHDSET